MITSTSDIDSILENKKANEIEHIFYSGMLSNKYIGDLADDDTRPHQFAKYLYNACFESKYDNNDLVLIIRGLMYIFDMRNAVVTHDIKKGFDIIKSTIKKIKKQKSDVNNSAILSFAYNYLGKIYGLETSGVLQNINLSEKYLRLAVKYNSNNVYAISNLGVMLVNNQRYDLGIKMLEKLCEMNYCNGFENIGMMYKRGLYYERNIDLAVTYFIKAYNLSKHKEMIDKIINTFIENLDVFIKCYKRASKKKIFIEFCKEHKYTDNFKKLIKKYNPETYQKINITKQNIINIVKNNPEITIKICESLKDDDSNKKDAVIIHRIEPITIEI